MSNLAVRGTLEQGDKQTSWQMVKLGEILTKSSEWVTINPDEQYRQITVRLWGKGVVQRAKVSGAEIASDRQFLVRQDQFILSRIDARNGAFGLIPDWLDGAVVSNDFPTFTLDTSRIIPAFLGWMSRTEGFINLCKAASEGTTNRVRLQEDRFLSMEIPLPPLDEQRRIVARIDELAARIEEARGLRREAVEEAEVLAASTLSTIFDYMHSDKLPNGWVWQTLDEMLINEKEGMVTGPFGTLLQRSDIQEAGTPVLGISNVQINRFVPGFNDFVSPEKASQLSSYRLEKDDIVVARSGTVGRSCVIPDGLDPTPLMSTNLIRLRLNSNTFLPELLCRLFNGSRLIERHIDEECRGSTRSFFTQKILSKLQVPVPSILEQQSILTFLKTIQAKADALKRLQAETAAELEGLLPSVLDQAFRGEL